MEDAQAKIVVLASYENGVMANLVKTKLDAYGIPCFLTGENFTALYPLSNDIFPGVRVHVFEADLDHVREVLTEEVVIGQESHECPHCKSSNVVHEAAKIGQSRGFTLFLSLLFLLPFPNHSRKTMYHCRDCDSEFDLAA